MECVWPWECNARSCFAMGMMCLIFNACDVWSSSVFPFWSKAYIQGFFLPHCWNWQCCASTYSFSAFFSFQVQIIRDNLISSLNHCDLVYSVSLACPTPLFPSTAFTISNFFPPLSLASSLNGALVSQMLLHRPITAKWEEAIVM